MYNIYIYVYQCRYIRSHKRMEHMAATPMVPTMPRLQGLRLREHWPLRFGRRVAEPGSPWVAVGLGTQKMNQRIHII